MNKRKKPSDTELQKFVFELTKLEPIEFLGVAHVFSVELFEDEERKTPVDFEVVVSEIIDGYVMLSRRKRRNLMRMLRATTKKEKEK